MTSRTRRHRNDRCKAVTWLWPAIAAGAVLLAASPAKADDWYVIGQDNTCTDVTASETASGNPQLGTPDGTEALYQSLGDTVLTTTLKDNSGATIIFMRINDSSGNPFVKLVFFPSLADCQDFLNYSKAHEN